MQLYTWLQAIVVAVLVAAAVLHLFGRFMPRTRRRAQTRLAEWLGRDSRPAPLRRIGMLLMPAQVNIDTGCGSGCGSCDGCAPPRAAEPSERPLEFHSRR